MTGDGLTYRRRVHYHECDLQGIIFNSHLYAYFDEALRNLARERPRLAPVLPGPAPIDGLGAEVSEARLRFVAPIRFDDELEIEIGVVNATDEAVLWDLTAMRSGSRVADGSIETRALTEGTPTRAPLPAAVRSELAAVTRG